MLNSVNLALLLLLHQRQPLPVSSDWLHPPVQLRKPTSPNSTAEDRSAEAGTGVQAWPQEEGKTADEEAALSGKARRGKGPQVDERIRYASWSLLEHSKPHLSVHLLYFEQTW